MFDRSNRSSTPSTSVARIIEATLDRDEQLADACERRTEVVLGDEVQRIVEREPLQLRVRGLCDDCVRSRGREDVTEIGVLVRGFTLAGRDRHDHCV